MTTLGNLVASASGSMGWNGNNVLGNDGRAGGADTFLSDRHRRSIHHDSFFQKGLLHNFERN